MSERWRNSSLRIRLTLLYIGLMTALIVAMLSVLVWDTRDFFIASTEQRLREQAQLTLRQFFVYDVNLVVSDALLPVVPPNRIPELSVTGVITHAMFTFAANQAAPISVTLPVSEAFVSAFRHATPADALLLLPDLNLMAKPLAQTLSSADTIAQIFEAQGKLLANGSSLGNPAPLAPTPAEGLAQVLAGADGFYEITNVAGQEILVILIPIRHRVSLADERTKVLGAVQLNHALAPLTQVFRRAAILVPLVAVITLGFGLMSGFWLTGSALKPLRAMIATCQRIAAGDLSQRVNLNKRQDEIGQLAAAFDEMVAQLQTATNRQQQFVADASHELRTPLTALRGSLDVMLLAPEGDPTLRHRMLHGMRREVERLTRLSSDLLTLTRLDGAHSPPMSEVDLSVLTVDVIESLRLAAGARTWQVALVRPLCVRGHTDRLRQVLVNLIANAIRFTDAEAGQIVVRGERCASGVTLTVSDNGIGIPPEAQPHIFERFYRADTARARADGGSGLGLAIVKAIVESHGGRVELAINEAGWRTTFRVTLP